MIWRWSDRVVPPWNLGVHEIPGLAVVISFWGCSFPQQSFGLRGSGYLYWVPEVGGTFKLVPALPANSEGGRCLNPTASGRCCRPLPSRIHSSSPISIHQINHHYY
jgi:hypothetical protein